MTIEEAVEKLQKIYEELSLINEEAHKLIHNPEEFKNTSDTALCLIEKLIEALIPGENE